MKQAGALPVLSCKLMGVAACLAAIVSERVDVLAVSHLSHAMLCCALLYAVPCYAVLCVDSQGAVSSHASEGVCEDCQMNSKQHHTVSLFLEMIF